MPLTRNAALCGGVLVWITVVLLLDTGATATQQHLLGAATWLVLLAALRGETATVRVQVAVVVVFATAVEYVFSHWLGVYTYRLDGVPMFVPPGHGLVYLAALSFGRTAWYLCLVAFAWKGRSPLLYVGAFVVVSYLEIAGTSLGTWTWGAVDPVLGVVTIGNPPSGIAGGYAWFDAAALWLTPVVLAWWSRRSGAPAELGVDPDEVVAHSRRPLEVEGR